MSFLGLVEMGNAADCAKQSAAFSFLTPPLSPQVPEYYRFHQTEK